MDEISLVDIESIFRNTLVLHKGVPVLFISINADRVATLFILEHGKTVKVKFELADFSAPRGRIGFVNHLNNAFYIKRRPRRQYLVGISGGNSEISPLPYGSYDERLTGKDQIRKLNLRCIHFAMKNEYPVFKEALAKAVASNGAYAFDKQFAVAYDRSIWYKNKMVGEIPKGRTSMKSIVFTKEYEYLQLPLLQNHGKIVRTFEAQ